MFRFSIREWFLATLLAAIGSHYFVGVTYQEQVINSLQSTGNEPLPIPNQRSP